MAKKLSQKKRDEMIEKLVEYELEILDTRDIADILREGCVGYENMDDETLTLNYNQYIIV